MAVETSEIRPKLPGVAIAAVAAAFLMAALTLAAATVGDNRDNSLDSRYWGFLQQADVIGKPFLIYDSEAGTAAEVELGRVRDTGVHIRWNRVFKLL